MTHNITKKTEEARILHAQLKEMMKGRGNLDWHIGAALSKMKKERLFKYVFGEGGDSWVEYCTEQIKIPLSTADQIISVYDFFVGKHGFEVEELKEYDRYSLYYITLYKRDDNKTEVKEWMKKSRNEELKRQDFVSELRGEECKHDHVHVEKEELQVCDTCKKVLMKLKKHGKGK